MYKTNDLLKYMSERYQQEQTKNKQPGPVITVSREYGCPAKRIVKILAAELTEEHRKKGKDVEWKWITKEILFEAAKELEMDPTNIRYVFDYKKKGLIDDILSAHMNKYYKSDRKIRNTIAKVIRSLSINGHVIIIGRGGVAIAKDIPKSLHINLEAPLEWRTLRVSEKNSMSLEDARKFTIDIDRKRKEFREYFEGKNTDYTRFDVCLNCMTLSEEEIAHTIVEMAKLRKLI
ncbi:MAG: AAA family ATPase [Bacteroidota bacterium]